MYILLWKLEYRSYSHNIGFSEKDIIITYKNDFQVLKKLIKRKVLLKPSKIILLKDNASKYEEDIIFYIKLNHNTYELLYDFQNIEFFKFRKGFLNTINFYNQYKYKSFYSSLNYMLSKSNNPLFSTLKSSFKSLKILFDVYYLPLLEYNICKDKKYIEKQHDWLDEINGFISFIQNYKSQLSSIPQTTFSQKVSIFLNQLITYLQTLTTSEDKLLFLSLYFLKMATIQFKNENYTLSYTLSHRAFDLFLLYECFLNNFATIRMHSRRAEMCIHYDIGSRYDNKDVNINQSLNVLVNQSIFTNNNKYVQFARDFFNENRNLSYLAHGIYSIKDKEAKIGLNFTKNFLSSRLTKGVFQYKMSQISFIEELSFLELFEDDKYYVETFYSEIELIKTPA